MGYEVSEYTRLLTGIMSKGKTENESGISSVAAISRPQPPSPYSHTSNGFTFWEPNHSADRMLRCLGLARQVDPILPRKHPIQPCFPPRCPCLRPLTILKWPASRGSLMSESLLSLWARTCLQSFLHWEKSFSRCTHITRLGSDVPFSASKVVYGLLVCGVGAIADSMSCNGEEETWGKRRIVSTGRKGVLTRLLLVL